MSKITIDMLAGMMNTSFEHLELEMKKEFEMVRDSIEKLDNNHERRIARLEDDVRVLKTRIEQ